jgi:hypothetical protein
MRKLLTSSNNNHQERDIVMKWILHLLLLGLIASCGNDHKGNTAALDTRSGESLESDEKMLAPKTTYVAVLDSINTDVAVVSGAVTVDVDGDFMATNVRFSSSLPNTFLRQSIHVGHLCPTLVADENLDGHVDAKEASAFTSEILIPLDGDLTSQYAEMGFTPLSDAWGGYIYSRVNSYKAFLLDLYAEDDNLYDNLIKLDSNTPFDLDQKVVVIYGLPETVVLPETVDGVQSSIPIACGVFTKVEKIPGQVEGDDVSRGTVYRPNPHPTPTPNRTGSRPRVNPPTTKPGGIHPGRNNHPRSSRCPRGKTCYGTSLPRT